MSIGKVIPLVPAIGADLRIGEVQASWLISVVTLAGVFVAPFGGVLSARFDDRAVLPAACVIAAAGSVLAGGLPAASGWRWRAGWSRAAPCS